MYLTLKFKLYIFYFSRFYAKARKDNYNNGDRSPSPTIYPFGMNTKGGFCDLAVLSLKQMTNKKSMKLVEIYKL